MDMSTMLTLNVEYLADKDQDLTICLLKARKQYLSPRDV